MSVLGRMAEKRNLNYEICTSDGGKHQGTDFFAPFRVCCEEISLNRVNSTTFLFTQGGI